MPARHMLITLTLVCSWLCLPSSSMALDRTRLHIETLQGAGWRAQQVEIVMQMGARPLRATLHVAQAQLSGVAEALHELSIACDDLQLLDDAFSCANARINGVFPYLGRQQFTGNARYQRTTGAIEITLRDLAVAKGVATLQAQLHDSDWQAQADLHATDLGELLKLAEHFGKPLALTARVSGSGSSSGRIDAELTARGRDSTPQQITWQIDAKKVTLNNQAGTVATDTLAFNTSGSARAAKPWQLSAQLQATAGQGYVEPVFVDFSQHPLSLTLQGEWDGKQRLQVQQLELVQQDIITATAHGVLQFDANNPAPQLEVQLAALAFPGSFATYLQPLLIDTAFKNLNTRGAMNGALQIHNSLPTRVTLQVHNLDADTGNGKLRLDHVNGDLHWRDALAGSETPQRSMISWQSGALLNFELGATQLPLELWGNNARLAAPTRIPVFNGALAIDAFRVRKLGTPQMAFMLDALIEPINVANVSKAFGWPEFGGALSGKITKLRLEDGVITLGATLAAQVFDGEVNISNLRLEGALTQWPRFNASIGIQQLDLAQVTQAFSFGLITGRLSGEINDLNLFNWQPVAFNARLYTPDEDRSKHRISQRAVQNIGRVGGAGGGVTAALQSGFLSFFKDFNYDKLGLSCQLIDEVCLMNGIAPAKGDSYYLVKGRGVPRIDVIGNGRRVDWPRFVAQLKAATESPGPVVK